MKLYNLLLLFCFVLLGCTNNEATNKPAPQQFTATFSTTKGEFDIRIVKAWSPKAADRMYNLINSGYFNKTLVYRVVPGFVAQFGPTDTLVMNRWKKIKVPDEKVVHSNTEGTVSFARSGKESRGFDVFINLRNNAYLDTLSFEGVKGYPAFGTVTRGMNVVHKLYDGYGERTMQDGALFANKALLQRAFPMLDGIVEAYITSEE